MRALRLIALACTATAAACSQAAPPETVACDGVPRIELTGRLVDNGAMLDTAGRTRVSEALADYEVATGRQLVVATITSLDGLQIHNYGHCLGNRWGIGDAVRDDGVIILLAKSERQMRIATGIGAEDLLTDEEAGRIVRQMTPRFRDGQIATGLLLGIEAIKAEMGTAS